MVVVAHKERVGNMKIRRRKSEVPGLNTTSTADISFMLLIFFLVTTSMYEAKGLVGQLPPKNDDKKEKKEIIVDKQNLMVITLDADGNLNVNDSTEKMTALKDRLEEFILRRGKEHLVSIDASPECKYETYFQLQQIVGKAYKEARERKAQEDYGRGLKELTSIDREKVVMSLPQRIAENFHENEPLPPSKGMAQAAADAQKGGGR